MLRQAGQRVSPDHNVGNSSQCSGYPSGRFGTMGDTARCLSWDNHGYDLKKLRYCHWCDHVIVGRTTSMGGYFSSSEILCKGGQRIQRFMKNLKISTFEIRFMTEGRGV